MVSRDMVSRDMVRGDMVSRDLVVPALYRAKVRHARRSPIRHRFAYGATYWLVDFDRLPEEPGIVRWCTRVRREDHVDIRAILHDKGVNASRIVMLSGARSFGYAFDPISVFWCYDEASTGCTVVAEVHNTYGDRHAYVLEPDGDGAAEIEKVMYVSPFNSVDGTYRIRVSPPGSSVSVQVSLDRAGQEPFVATLQATRRPFTAFAAVSAAVRHSGLRTRALIQWEALRLWRRGLKVQPR
jgi:DUF1365 family protein